MTAVVTPQASPLANSLAEISPADESLCANVFGGSGTLYMVEIDNSGNPAERVYVKLYDAATATVGTTDPDWIFNAPASERKTYAIPAGVDFSVGLSAATVISGGTGGATGPSNPVVVRLLAS